MTHQHEHKVDYRGVPVCYCGDALELPPLKTALAEADAAIEQVTDNANDEWLETAYQVGVRLADTRSDFVSDDFHPVFEALGVTVHDKRALGGVIRKLKANGVIEATGQYRRSKRRHGTPLQVWRRVDRKGGHDDYRERRTDY